MPNNWSLPFMYCAHYLHALLRTTLDRNRPLYTIISIASVEDKEVDLAICIVALFIPRMACHWENIGMQLHQHCIGQEPAMRPQLWCWKLLFPSHSSSTGIRMPTDIWNSIEQYSGIFRCSSTRSCFWSAKSCCGGFFPLIVAIYSPCIYVQK